MTSDEWRVTNDKWLMTNHYRFVISHLSLIINNSLILFDDSKKMTNLRLVIIFLDEVAQIIYLFPTDSPYNRLYH